MSERFEGSSLSESAQMKLALFMSRSGADIHTAFRCLEFSRWDLEAALRVHFLITGEVDEFQSNRGDLIQSNPLASGIAVAFLIAVLAYLSVYSKDDLIAIMKKVMESAGDTEKFIQDMLGHFAYKYGRAFYKFLEDRYFGGSN